MKSTEELNKLSIEIINRLEGLNYGEANYLLNEVQQKIGMYAIVVPHPLQESDQLHTHTEDLQQKK